MRGLSDEERNYMLGDYCLNASDPLVVGLESRGLLREGSCVDEVEREYEMYITPEGHRALRIDAAARLLVNA